MSDYFEKLKKSMGANPQNTPKEPEEEPTEDITETEPVIAELTPIQEEMPAPKKAPVKKRKKPADIPQNIATEEPVINPPEIKKAEVILDAIKPEISPIKQNTIKKEEIKPIKQKKKMKITEEKKFDSSFPLLTSEKEGKLAIDVYQTDGEIIIQSAVGGVSPENLDVSIENDLVSIRGVRENPIKDQGKNYFRQECHWGSFSREIILPEEADGSKAEASIKNGILVVKIPKTGGDNKNKIIIEKI
jgi:HSP20 family molecular chaperone IbpA